MKLFIISIFIFAGLSCSQPPETTSNASAMSNTTQPTPKTLHEFSVTDIEGNNFDFASLKGKRVLIVNVASKCGFTPQYKELQKLYETYGNENFVIIGFPANDFMGQEPGSDEEIASFCEKNYGVTFPLMSKISVKGKSIHPLYAWLTQKELNGKDDYNVRWNFHKFLIDENGQIVADFGSRTSPMSDEITSFAAGKS